MITIVNNLKAEWSDIKWEGEFNGNKWGTSEVTISWAKPIKYIKVTGVTKDGSCKMFHMMYMDQTLGENTLIQLMKRVEQKLRDQDKWDNYWITWKIPTDEEIAKHDPLTQVWTKDN